MRNKQDYITLLGNPNVNAFLLTVRNGEGTLGPSGYTTRYGNIQFSNSNDHPINTGEWLGTRLSDSLCIGAGQSPGCKTTAAGAYQFLVGTWNNLKSALSLPDFRQLSQDIAALRLIDQKGAIDNIVNGDITIAMNLCKSIWASLPNSIYGQPTQTVAAALDFYKRNGGSLNPASTPDTGNGYVDLKEKIYPASAYTWDDYFVGQQRAKGTVFTSIKHNWGEYSGAECKRNAIAIFENIIDPLTIFTGKLTFSSTYRTFVPEGGASLVSTAHSIGCAVDITGFGSKSKAEAYKWLTDNVCNVVDQGLYEGTSGAYPASGGWIHVGIHATPSGSLIARKEFLNFQNHQSQGVVPGLSCNQTQAITNPSDIATSSGDGTGGYPGSTTDKQQQDIANALKINLDSIYANVYALEQDNTLATWGARSSQQEQSDWIGLRQFLIYLVTTFAPQSMIPFVELIPKFTLESAVDNAVSDAKTTGFEYQLGDLEKKRMSNTESKLKNLQDSGGTDLISLDPFGDIAGFNDAGGSNGHGVSKSTRNLTYKIFGNLSLTPGIQGSETSKAGAIGLTKLEIQQGSAIQQGVTLITIDLLDVQGNKFLDVASPWSFLLNGSQAGGDFWLRYGWQLQIPKYDASEKDINSNSYKFWNHEGWLLFNDVNGNNEIKQNLKNNLGVSDWVLNLTQSTEMSAFWYNGYKNVEDSKGSFISDLRTGIGEAYQYYLSISMINPSISVNSEDGSITASIQFATENSLLNFSCPITQSENIKKLLGDKPEMQTTLFELMKAFVTDNNVFVNSNEKLKSKASKIITENQVNDESKITSWCTVKSLSTGETGLDPRNIKINITQEDLKRLQTSTTDNALLRGWIYDVLGSNNNNLTPVALGDQGGQTGGGFYFIYDDEGITTNSLDMNKATGNLTNTSFKRMLAQDDVYSFRFRGSLIESLAIEKNDTPTDQTLNIQQMMAKSEVASMEVVSASGSDGNKPTADVPGLPAPVDTIKWNTKKKYLQFLLSNMAATTIKAIAHPWMKVGNIFYIKGNGYFDGRYIASKVTHTLNAENEFTTEINGVRSINQDFIDLQKQTQDREAQSQNSTGGVGIFGTANDPINKQIEMNKKEGRNPYAGLLGEDVSSQLSIDKFAKKRTVGPLSNLINLNNGTTVNPINFK